MISTLDNYASLVKEALQFSFPEVKEREELLRDIPEPAVFNLVHIITGIRRSGKTFYLFQLINRLLAMRVPRKNIFYFNFTDDRLQPAPATMLNNVIEEYWRQVPEARTQGCYLFLDEVQEAQDWQRVCQRIAEHERVTLVITGSSSKLSADQIATQFRGRSQEHAMFPLSFKEYCTFHSIAVPTTEELQTGAISSQDRVTLESAYDRYLVIGGFPGVQHLTPEDRIFMLQSYVRDVVARDVVEQNGRINIDLANQVALFGLRNTGCDLSINRLVDALKTVGYKTSWDTINEAVRLFTQAHLFSLVSEYTTSLSPNSTATQKVYALDPGMAYATARANQQDMGKRLETAIHTELCRQTRSSREESITSYTAPTPKREKVDFLRGDALAQDSYQLIQVTVDMTAPKTRERELSSLAVALKKTGATNGLIITLREEGTEEFEAAQDTRTVRIIPAWKWSLLSA